MLQVNSMLNVRSVRVAKATLSPSHVTFFLHQSLLYLHDGISASMKEDIDSFNYTWLLQFVRRFDWGEDLTNMLFVGMPDVVTPAHFDILENLYVQVSLYQIGLFTGYWGLYNSGPGRLKSEWRYPLNKLITITWLHWSICSVRSYWVFIQKRREYWRRCSILPLVLVVIDITISVMVEQLPSLKILPSKLTTWHHFSLFSQIFSTPSN